jgi:hypothetical protein
LSPTVRQTLWDSGWMKKNMGKVWETIYRSAVPLTQKETVLLMWTDDAPEELKAAGKGKTRAAERSIGTLFAPMARAGLLVRAGKRRCAVTGNMVWAWDVTDNFPTKEALRKATIRPPKASIDASKNEEIASLTKQVKILTAQAEQLQRVVKAKTGLCDTLVVIIDTQRAKIVELEAFIDKNTKTGKKYQAWKDQVFSAQQTHLPGI